MLHELLMHRFHARLHVQAAVGGRERRPFHARPARGCRHTVALLRELVGYWSLATQARLKAALVEAELVVLLTLVSQRRLRNAAADLVRISLRIESLVM